VDARGYILIIRDVALSTNSERIILGKNLTRWLARDMPGPWWERTLSGAVALLMGLGTLWLLYLLAWPLALFVAAVALAAAVSPPVEWLARWIPRTLAVILFYLLLLGLFILLGWWVLPLVWVQARAVVESGPQFIEQWQERLGNWLPGDGLSIGVLIESFFTDGVTNTLSQWSRGVTGLVTAFLVVFFGSLYALLEAPRASRFLHSLVPPGTRERMYDVLHEMLNAMGGFVRGEVLSALIIGTVTYIGLSLLNFPYALVLAVMAGLLEFLPIVGPFITAIVLVLVGLTQSVNQALVVLGFSIVLQQFESNIVVPNVMRQEAKVSPLLVLLALLGGERIGGLVGALVAIPLVAGLRVVVLRLVVPGIRRWTGADIMEIEEAHDAGS
jgi:predicted PurR-regulated permease PerM